MGKRVILAVAGAGKTYHICHNINPDKKNLILAFTHENIYNIIKELTKSFGSIPAKTTICTFHSFVYQLLIRPYEPTIFDVYGEQFKNTRGVSFAEIPKSFCTDGTRKWSNKNYHKVTDIAHFMTPSRQYYCGLMTDLLIRVNKKNKNFLPHIFKSINEFYEAIYVDEFQDFREKDFEIIKMMVLNVENILLVGDYYQHSVSGKNNTGMPFKDGKKSISYEQFISELAGYGFEVDSHLLNKSRRCSAEVCAFIREKLGIKIFSQDIHQGKVIEVPEDRVKEIISNDDIVKLVYSNAKNYNCFCKNWSYSKGDTYDSICVVLTEKSNNIFKENWNNNLSESSRNKLYVALTRSSGDVYIMSSQQFAREVSK